jgi:formylglycine-generating enzyme required for sulfatase activity
MKDGTAVKVRATIEMQFGSERGAWHSESIGFAPAAGVTPPVVKDGAMPKPDKEISNESVDLGFTVDSRGSVTNIHTISGSQSASDLLSRSLATWKFQPAMKGILPVEATGTVRFVKGRGDEAAKLPLSPPVPQSNPSGREYATTPESISSVVFTGSPANPTILIAGQGFNPRPAVTSAGRAGSTGDDYGTSLHVTDSTGPTAFHAGYDVPSVEHDSIGLVVSAYSDNLISYSLGSIYRSQYYPSRTFQLNEGDSFTVYVRNSALSGIVHYQVDGGAYQIPASPGSGATGPVSNVGQNPPSAYPGESVDGKLRRLAEKDLLLQTSSGKVLRFRLIAKTEFRTKNDKPLRDSLMHAGDGIVVYVNPDDVETALYVILINPGNASEREAGSVPVEEPSIAAPVPDDFAKAPSEKSAPLTAVGPIRAVDPSGAPRDPIVNTKDGQRYVWIPPGAFTMGCSPGDTECFNNEKPPHTERIANGFWLGQTEVTQAAYVRVTGGNPSAHKGDQLPVERVTWNDAVNYCAAIGGRLPTEAEWEYAARAGSTGARYGDLEAVAWHRGNSGGMTHPVAMKQPNTFGLYDMLGNVWEWVEDSYAGTTSKIMRGGTGGNVARNTRASSRSVEEPSASTAARGFRCAVGGVGDNRGSVVAGEVSAPVTA